MAVQLSAVGARVWLFRLKSFQGVRGSLSINVIREVCSYLEDPLLYQVSPDFLRSFNCHTSTWGTKVSLSTSIQVDRWSAWAVLEDGHLFCSGGGKNYAGLSLPNAAFLISREGKVKRLPDMQTPRGVHGVIQVLQVYAFGGSK